MLKVHRWFILLGMLFIVFIALSFDFKSTKIDSDFRKWVNNFAIDLENAGISEKTITQFKEFAQLTQTAIDAYEQRKSSINLTTAVGEDLLLKAQVFYRENQDWLVKKEKEYKIPSRVVVGMFGVNSYFGERLGDYILLNVLSSLAYNKSSSEEYKLETIAFLNLVDKGYVPISTLGHDDGTFTYMGIKPTIYAVHGIDGNNDGRVDLFTSKDDIVETSYGMLKTLGMERQSWGNEISIPDQIDFTNKQGVKYVDTLDNWKGFRITSYNKEKLPKDKRAAFLILLESKNHGLLLYSNFTALLNTNNNIQRTLSIFTLSDKLSTASKVLEYKQTNKVVTKEEECDCEDDTSYKSNKQKKDDMPINRQYKEIYGK